MPPVILKTRLRALALAALSVATFLPFPAQAGDLPGYDRLSVPAAHRPASLPAAVWYPAGGATYKGLVGDNAVFVGTPAEVGAPVAGGRHPLVLVSHGSGGNIDNLGWLASGLAERGMMVLGVNHPGSTTGDSSPRRSIRHWERAQDLSAALDAILADPTFGPAIDPTRISVVGFSLGGATALSLSGARTDRDAYRRYCEDRPAAPDCVFFAKGGVDLARVPAEEFGRDVADPRISRAVAVDPALTYAMTAESLAAIDHPVAFVNIGREGERWAAIDVGPGGSGAAARVPGASHVEIPEGNHFTFLGLCKPGGAAILADERDDPVCTDPDGVDRAKVHRELLDAIAGFLLRGGA